MKHEERRTVHLPKSLIWKCKEIASRRGELLYQFMAKLVSDALKNYK